MICVFFLKFFIKAGGACWIWYLSLHRVWYHRMALSALQIGLCALPHQPVLSGRHLPETHVRHSVKLLCSATGCRVCICLDIQFHFSFREENSGFRRIVEKLERSPVCQRLPLRSFLVLPFQRIIRIRLLVQVCMCVCVCERISLTAMLMVHNMFNPVCDFNTRTLFFHRTSWREQLLVRQRQRRPSKLWNFWRRYINIPILCTCWTCYILSWISWTALWQNSASFIYLFLSWFKRVTTASLRWKALSLWSLSVLKWALSAG